MKTAANKLISDFMELETYGETEFLYKGKICNLSSMQYNVSWDWLIPVVKKIREITNVELSINDFECVGEMDLTLNPYDYTIDQVYKAVIEFIEWINEQAHIPSF